MTIFVILIVGACLLATGYFLSANILAEKEIEIQATPFEVFDNISNLRAWQVWHPLCKDSLLHKVLLVKDSACKTAFNNTADYKNTVSISLQQLTPLTLVSYVIKVGEKGSLAGVFFIEAKDSVSNVRLRLEGILPNNPFLKWYAFIFKNNIENQIDTTLLHLKQYIEKNVPNSLRAEVITLPERFVITQKDTASVQSLNEKMLKMFTALSEVAKRNNIKKVGKPFCIFHSCSSNYFEIETGLTIPEKIGAAGTCNFLQMPAQKYVMLKYSGLYSKTNEAYVMINKYINLNNYKYSGGFVEEYPVNPEIEKDTNQWHTNIYFPVN